MNKSSVLNAAVVIASAFIGGGWLCYLSSLSAGRGLVNMDPQTLIFDLIVVGVLSLVCFVFNLDLALSAWGGWLGGQLILLIWDGMPRGRSPQMFQPTNVGEALILGLIIVVVLNWSALPGALLGLLLRFIFNRKRLP